MGQGTLLIFYGREFSRIVEISRIFLHYGAYGRSEGLEFRGPETINTVQANYIRPVSSRKRWGEIMRLLSRTSSSSRKCPLESSDVDYNRSIKYKPVILLFCLMQCGREVYVWLMCGQERVENGDQGKVL